MAGAVLGQNIVQYPDLGSGPLNVDSRGKAFGSSVESLDDGLPAGDREVLQFDGNAPTEKDRVVSEVVQNGDGSNERAEIDCLKKEIDELEKEIMQQSGEFSPISDEKIRDYEGCIRGFKGEIDNVHKQREQLIALFSSEFVAPLKELIQMLGEFREDDFDKVHLCHLDQRTPVSAESIFYASDIGVGLSGIPTAFTWDDVPFSAIESMFNNLDVSAYHGEGAFVDSVVTQPSVPQPFIQGNAKQKYTPIPGQDMGTAERHSAAPVQGSIAAPSTDFVPASDSENPRVVPDAASMNKGEVFPFSGQSDVVRESQILDENKLQDNTRKSIFIWKLFEKLLDACPASLKGSSEVEAGLKTQVLENLKKEESLSSVARDNQLEALKERKKRLENIRSYFKELSVASEWMRKMELFVNRKEALKGIAKDGGGSAHDDSRMNDKSQKPLPQADLVVHA
ncbi:hypothetical protein [Endozoicomonas elysicola]|uniref:Uncharacterized protein n=1 Tax=Endozoicomonas elysicola TaxID=305900 RepID=A0A081K7J4_9GAMM|nr:hypothetical protein [Endozoicomonas elysicola]KEI70120.1 hypothetical protein GV64_04590 [Endozoicomonas elysicola]